MTCTCHLAVTIYSLFYKYPARDDAISSSLYVLTDILEMKLQTQITILLAACLYLTTAVYGAEKAIPSPPEDVPSNR